MCLCVHVHRVFLIHVCAVKFLCTHLWPTLSRPHWGFVCCVWGSNYTGICVCVCVFCLCVAELRDIVNVNYSPSRFAIAPRAWLWQWRSHSVSTAAISARMAPRELLSWLPWLQEPPVSWRERMQCCSWTRRSLTLPVCKDDAHRYFLRHCVTQ